MKFLNNRIKKVFIWLSNYLINGTIPKYFQTKIKFELTLLGSQVNAVNKVQYLINTKYLQIFYNT